MYKLQSNPMDVIIDLRQFSYEDIMDLSFDFKNKTILVHTPFVSADKRIPLNYFIFDSKFIEFQEFAKLNSIKLIFDIMLSGMGTKRFRKKVLRKFLNKKKDLLYQIKNLSNNSDLTLMKRSLFVDKKKSLFFRKNDYTKPRILDLDNFEVTELHIKMLENLNSMGIKGLNIVDYEHLDNKYVESIFKGLDIKVHSFPHKPKKGIHTYQNTILIVCERVDISEDTELVEDDVISTICNSSENIIQVVSSQNFVKEYENTNTQVDILTSRRCIVIVNKNETSYHKCNKMWPKRKLKQPENGHYEDLMSNQTVDLHNGDFKNQVLTEESSVTVLLKN